MVDKFVYFYQDPNLCMSNICSAELKQKETQFLITIGPKSKCLCYSLCEYHCGQCYSGV